MSLVEHAKRELELYGVNLEGELSEDDPAQAWGDLTGRAVLELIKIFAEQGHSGFSAATAIGLFKRLASFEPLTPLRGTDDEWNEVGEGVWQNNRCGRVFKGADGRAYDIDGKVFREPNGSCFTSSDSRVYVEFPYTPATEYVDVQLSEEDEETEDSTPSSGKGSCCERCECKDRE